MEQTERWSPLKRMGACVTAATLAIAMVPTAALYDTAYADDLAAAQVGQLAAQEAQAMVSAWLNNAGAVSPASTRSFDANVAVEQVSAGYQIDITYISKKTVALDKFQYKGEVDATVVSEDDEKVVYRIVADSIDGAIPITYGYTLTYGGSEHAHVHEMNLVVAADANALATKQARVSAELATAGIEVGKDYVAPVTWASPTDGHDVTAAMTAASVNNKVGITKNEEGTFNVILRPTSDMVKGFEYPAETALKANDNGTYQFTTDALDGGFRILTKIVTPTFAHDQDQIMSITLTGIAEGSIMDEAVSVDKTNLNEAIKTAKALEQGSKSDEAWAALQSAIATAEAVANKEDATEQEVHPAYQAMRAAIAAFNASEDQPATPPASTGLDADLRYLAPLSVLKADADEPSMAAAYLDSRVQVFDNNGSYRVLITANDAAAEQNLKLYYADGTEVAKASDSPLAFSLVTDSISEPISIKFGADAMAGRQPQARLAIDADALCVGVERLFNPSNGEHFFTASTSEYAAIMQAGFRDEGIGWGAPISSEQRVHRVYNTVVDRHHYTCNEDEYNILMNTPGWTDEGQICYSASADGIPVYRLYNPDRTTNDHHFTSSSEEQALLLGQNWGDEGVGWYAVQ